MKAVRSLPFLHALRALFSHSIVECFCLVAFTAHIAGCTTAKPESTGTQASLSSGSSNPQLILDSQAVGGKSSSAGQTPIQLNGGKFSFLTSPQQMHLTGDCNTQTKSVLISLKAKDPAPPLKIVANCNPKTKPPGPEGTFTTDIFLVDFYNLPPLATTLSASSTNGTLRTLEFAVQANPDYIPSGIQAPAAQTFKATASIPPDQASIKAFTSDNVNFSDGVVYVSDSSKQGANIAFQLKFQSPLTSDSFSKLKNSATAASISGCPTGSVCTVTFSAASSDLTTVNAAMNITAPQTQASSAIQMSLIFDANLTLTDENGAPVLLPSAPQSIFYQNALYDPGSVSVTFPPNMLAQTITNLKVGQNPSSSPTPIYGNTNASFAIDHNHPLTASETVTFYSDSTCTNSLESTFTPTSPTNGIGMNVWYKITDSSFTGLSGACNQTGVTLFYNTSAPNISLAQNSTTTLTNKTNTLTVTTNRQLKNSTDKAYYSISSANPGSTFTLDSVDVPSDNVTLTLHISCQPCNSGVTGGTLSLTSKATDIYGNTPQPTSSKIDFTYKASLAAPTISLQNPTSKSSNSYNISAPSFSITKADPNVSVTLFADSGNAMCDGNNSLSVKGTTDSSGSGTANFTNLKDGNYLIHYSVYDSVYDLNSSCSSISSNSIYNLATSQFAAKITSDPTTQATNPDDSKLYAWPASPGAGLIFNFQFTSRAPSADISKLLNSNLQVTDGGNLVYPNFSLSVSPSGSQPPYQNYAVIVKPNAGTTISSPLPINLTLLAANCAKIQDDFGNPLSCLTNGLQTQTQYYKDTFSTPTFTISPGPFGNSRKPIISVTDKQPETYQIFQDGQCTGSFGSNGTLGSAPNNLAALNNPYPIAGDVYFDYKATQTATNTLSATTYQFYYKVQDYRFNMAPSACTSAQLAATQLPLTYTIYVGALTATLTPVTSSPSSFSGVAITNTNPVLFDIKFSQPVGVTNNSSMSLDPKLFTVASNAASVQSIKNTDNGTNQSFQIALLVSSTGAASNQPTPINLILNPGTALQDVYGNPMSAATTSLVYYKGSVQPPTNFAWTPSGPYGNLTPIVQGGAGAVEALNVNSPGGIQMPLPIAISILDGGLTQPTCPTSANFSSVNSVTASTTDGSFSSLSAPQILGAAPSAHNYMLVATDIAGNISCSNNFPYQFNASQPTVTILATNSGSNANFASFPVTVSCSYPTNTVTATTVVVSFPKYSSLPAISCIIPAGSSQSSVSQTLNLWQVPDGQNILLQAAAQDQYGNMPSVQPKLTLGTKATAAVSFSATAQNLNAQTLSSLVISGTCQSIVPNPAPGGVANATVTLTLNGSAYPTACTPAGNWQVTPHLTSSSSVSLSAQVSFKDGVNTVTGGNSQTIKILLGLQNTPSASTAVTTGGPAFSLYTKSINVPNTGALPSISWPAITDALGGPVTSYTVTLMGPTLANGPTVKLSSVTIDTSATPLQSYLTVGSTGNIVVGPSVWSNSLVDASAFYFTVNATDVAGNVSPTWQSQTFWTDFVLPTSPGLSLASNTTKTQTYTPQLTFSPPGSSVSSFPNNYTYQIQIVSGTTVVSAYTDYTTLISAELAAAASGGPYSFTLPVNATLALNTNYSVWLKTTDSKGGYTELKSTQTFQYNPNGTGTGTQSLTTTAVTVVPYYSNAIPQAYPINNSQCPSYGAPTTDLSHWNDYVDVAATTSPSAAIICNPTTSTNCVHSGEMRKVVLPNSTSCTSLYIKNSSGNATDELGQFKWACGVDPTTGKAYFQTNGFQPGMGLKTLLQYKSAPNTIPDPNSVGWTTNQITIWNDTFDPTQKTPMYQSNVANWWPPDTSGNSNPIRYYGTSSTTSINLNLNMSACGNGAGLIAVFDARSANITIPSVGYNQIGNLFGDRQAIVVLGNNALIPTATGILHYDWTGVGANYAYPNCNSNAENCFIYAEGVNFLWIEGNFDGANSNKVNNAANDAMIGLGLFNTKFARVHNSSIANFQGTLNLNGKPAIYGVGLQMINGMYSSFDQTTFTNDGTNPNGWTAINLLGTSTYNIFSGITPTTTGVYQAPGTTNNTFGP